MTSHLFRRVVDLPVCPGAMRDLQSTEYNSLERPSQLVVYIDYVCMGVYVHMSLDLFLIGHSIKPNYKMATLP